MRLLQGFAGPVEQVRELPKLPFGKVAQLAAMQIAHGPVQFAEQTESLRGDASPDDAAVLRFARPGDQPRPPTSWQARPFSPAPLKMRRMLYWVPERP
jgi:hypothetical protein